MTSSDGCATAAVKRDHERHVSDVAIHSVLFPLSSFAEAFAVIDLMILCE